MKEKLLLITSILIVSLLATATTATKPVKAQATTLTIVPALVTGINIDQTFKINITVNNVNDLWSWKVKFSWNPNYLSLVRTGTGPTDFDITEGPFLKDVSSTLFLPTPPNETGGYIPELSCSMLAASGATGTGTLATLNFKGKSLGTSSLNLSQTVLLDWITAANKTKITHTVVNGTAIVIPEFSGSMILPLFLGTTTIIVIMAVMVRSRRRRGYMDVP